MAEEAGMIAAARASEEEKAREREGDPSDEIEEGEIEDGDADSDADAARRGGAQSHPLEHSWTFWFDNPSAKSKQTAWGSSIRPIHTFATLLALIGEQFEYGDEICGAVVSVRMKQERIALWTKNAANEEAQVHVNLLCY
ncbi:hypothetical protein BHE74_00023049 [Ensete ventricosum]|nr:hypothetical protein GW17_00055441 [Ensete ventricosum]RWW69369.1 hypothetical protein BHE74_00023049 [Ensete ventricosum]